jgi:ABC-type transport system involved in resistance to organic solvents, permease component
VQFLVVPRFLAMMVMLPALTIFGNYIGILGGWAVCVSRSISTPPATS